MPFTAEADAQHPFKRQLHTIHVVAVPGTIELLSRQCAMELWIPIKKDTCVTDTNSSLVPGYAMLMRPNKDETAVHGWKLHGLFGCVHE